MLNKFKVPQELIPLFEKAQEYVDKYFSNKIEALDKGVIEISGQRYIMIRAASLSVDFFKTIKNFYKNYGQKESIAIAERILFATAQAIGIADAKNFHSQMEVKEPISKLSAGPIHFAYTGWGVVNILPESNITTDENFCLIYEHTDSFEAQAWGKEAKTTSSAVCIMNAGYLTGWCKESFGIDLVASEILCKAKGDKICRFIMAHPSKIEKYIKEYMQKESSLFNDNSNYSIPGLLSLEEEKNRLELVNQEWQKTFDAINDFIFIQDNNFTITKVNKAFAQAMKLTPQEIIGKKCYQLLHKQDKPWQECPLERTYADKQSHSQTVEDINIGIPLLVTTSPIIDEDGKLVGVIHIAKDISQMKKKDEELNKKVRDLEIFFKAAVERELKMEDLKRQIKELEDKIKK